jgi:uncharacterized protein
MLALGLPLGLLVIANVFMTFAWYGHLKNLGQSPLWVAILSSWALAFVEYCFQVPANRIGFRLMSLGQLKVAQEVITMVVFFAFSTWVMKRPVTRDLFYATICLALAAFFMFRGGLNAGR